MHHRSDPLRRRAGGAASLAACGGGDDERHVAAAPSGGRAARSRSTVEHKFGATEIPSEPKRVVTVGYTDQDAVARARRRARRRRRLPRRLRVARAPVGAGGARRRRARGRRRPGDQLRGRRRAAAGPDHRHQRRPEEGRLRAPVADRADRRASPATTSTSACRGTSRRCSSARRSAARSRRRRSSTTSRRSSRAFREAHPGVRGQDARSSPTAGPTATAPTRPRTPAAASSPTSASRRPTQIDELAGDSFFVAVQPGAVPADGPGPRRHVRRAEGHPGQPGRSSGSTPSRRTASIYLDLTDQFAGALGFASALSLPYLLDEAEASLAAAVDGDPATAVSQPR